MKRILLLLILCFGVTSFAQTTWTGAGGINTNWNNVANWNNNLVPTASDDVIIPTGFTVTLNVAGTVKSIAVQGNSTFNVNTNLSCLNASSFATNVTVNWSNGIFTGGGTLTNNGTVNLTTNGTRYISGGTTITNNGVFTMPAGGYLFLYDTSVFNNAALGVFDFQSDAVISYSGSSHSFNNAGLLKKTAGTGSTSFQAILSNTGTISAGSGTLSLNSLGKTFNGGIYKVTSGNVLSLDVLINVSGTLTGALNGAMNWNSDLSVATSATFNFTGSNPLNWNSGILSGGGTLTNTSKISLTTSGSRYISGVTTLNNTGTVTMPAAGYLYLYDTSVFNNTASGVFDFQSDAVVSYAGSVHSFNNAGLLKKSAGTGSASFQAILNNTGTISVESGTLSLSSLGKMFNGGVYNVSAGNALSLDVLANVSGTLTGTLNGVLNWNSTLSVATLATFNFTGSNPVNWNSGTLTGGGILTNASKISLTTNGSRYISDGTTLKNTGLVTMPAAGYLYLYDTAVFNNTLTGVFDIQSDALISYAGGTHNFINAGLLKKTTTTGNAQILCSLTNTGIIAVEKGTLSMTSLAKTFNGGVYNVSAGSQMILGIQINVSNTLTGVLDGAMTWSNDVSVASLSTFNFTGSTQVNWNSGSLIGGGTLTNATTINLTSNGSRYITGGTTLKNTGLVTMPAGGYLYLYDTSVFNNTSGAIFDIQSDAIISYSSTAHNFNNAGLIKKTAGVGITQIQCYLTNTGTISVESGTLSMNSLAKTFDGGVYNVTTGSQLILGIQVNVSNILTGLLDGAITWTSDVSVATDATFNFTGSAQVNWNSGSLIGGGKLTNASRIKLTTNGSRYILGTVTTLANTGLITMPAGGYLYLYDNTILDNKATGVIDFQSDCIVSYSGGGTFHISNAGIFKKTAGSGITYVYPPTTNSGTIDASSGTLTFVDGFNLINTVNGIVKGTSTIDLPADVNLTNDGTFAPGGSPGVLTVLGNYKSSASSKLNVELNGLTQGTQYDLLAITGTNVIFNGTVAITMGFEGSIGNQFTIATTSGTIATANLQSPIGNVDFNGFRYTFDVSYPLNNKVVLTITNKVDILPPNVITKNSTVQLDASGNASVTAGQINNGSTDNYTIPANLLYSLNMTSFTCANLGANTVMLKVTDEAGNFASAPATVTVIDVIAPAITCPSDFTVQSPGAYMLPDYFANNTVVASDNCAVVTKTQTPATGTLLANGEHTISFAVFDASGNTKTCSFKLTVNDTSLSTDGFKLSENNIFIFPNPVVDVVTIKNRSNLELLNVEIIDVTGKVLNRIDLSNMGNFKEISLTNYSKGMYFIKVKSVNSSITKRIIKK